VGNLPLVFHFSIRVGSDILAHTTPASRPWTPSLLERLKSAHAALIPTLTLRRSESKSEPIRGKTSQHFSRCVKRSARARSCTQPASRISEVHGRAAMERATDSRRSTQIRCCFPSMSIRVYPWRVVFTTPDAGAASYRPPRTPSAQTALFRSPEFRYRSCPAAGASSGSRVWCPHRPH